MANLITYSLYPPSSPPVQRQVQGRPDSGIEVCGFIAGITEAGMEQKARSHVEVTWPNLTIVYERWTSVLMAQFYALSRVVGGEKFEVCTRLPVLPTDVI